MHIFIEKDDGEKVSCLGNCVLMSIMFQEIGEDGEDVWRMTNRFSRRGEDGEDAEDDIQSSKSGEM